MKKMWVIFLLLVACDNTKVLNFGNELDYFSDDFIDFFPRKIRNFNSKFSISQNISNAHPHVWLKYYPNQMKIDSLIQALETKSIAIYDSEDSCLLVIDQYLNEENWFKFNKTDKKPKKVDYIEKDCQIGKFPVPNFYQDWISESDQTLTKLKGYQMFVLDAKVGVFLDLEKLPKSVYFPKGWKHGYSKGVAINSETGSVIYWADIW